MTRTSSADTAFVRRCVTVALIAILVLTIVWFVWAVSHALLLVFSAFLMAVGIDGLARLLRWPLPISQHKAVCLTAILLAVLLGAALTMGGMNVAARAPEMRRQVEQSLDQLQSRIRHNNLAQALMGQSKSATSGGSSATGKLGEQLTGELSGVASVTLSTLTDLFLVAVIGLYFALQPRLYQQVLLRLFPPASQDRVAHISAEAAFAVRRWLTGRIISMTVVGVGSALGLWLIGIPFAFLLGFIAGLLTFIPYLGALISAVPAFLIAALHGYTAVIYVGVLYLGLHILEGYLLAPLIQKRAASIAPGFLLSAQVLGGSVAGVLGVALAAPIALVVAVVIQLSYVRDIMGEQPHLPGHDNESPQRGERASADE